MERAGDLRAACVQAGNVGDAYAGLGMFAEAERVLRETRDAADRMGLRSIATSARTNLARAVAQQGRSEEARALATEAVEGDPRTRRPIARVYLAATLLAADPTAAEIEARAALEAFAASPAARPLAQATLAEVLLARGEDEEAVRLAREAMAALVTLGEIEEGEGIVRLVYARALAAMSDPEALAAAKSAVARLQARANRIGDPTLRASFLERVPEHAASSSAL